MDKAYKYRIYPNKKQKEQLAKTFGCCRFVFNHYLAKRIEKYEADKVTFTYYDCANDLTDREQEIPHLCRWWDELRYTRRLLICKFML